MTKIIMNGCNGKMGQVITRLVSEDNECEIVAGFDVNDSIENTYPVSQIQMNLQAMPML